MSNNEMAISHDYLPSHSVDQILMLCLLKPMHSKLSVRKCVTPRHGKKWYPEANFMHYVMKIIMYHELLFANEWTQEHVERLQPDCADNAKRPRAI